MELLKRHYPSPLWWSPVSVQFCADSDSCSLYTVRHERNPSKDRAPEVLILGIQIYAEKVDWEGLGVDKIFLTTSWKEEKSV